MAWKEQCSCGMLNASIGETINGSNSRGRTTYSVYYCQLEEKKPMNCACQLAIVNDSTHVNVMGTALEQKQWCFHSRDKCWSQYGVYCERPSAHSNDETAVATKSFQNLVAAIGKARRDSDGQAIACMYESARVWDLSKGKEWKR